MANGAAAADRRQSAVPPLTRRSDNGAPGRW